MFIEMTWSVVKKTGLKMLAVCLFLLLYSIFTVNLKAKEKKLIAVIAFNANNVPKATVQIARNIIEMNLYNRKEFRLLEREKIDIVFRELRIKRYTGKIKSIVLVGKTLSADFIIAGSIDKTREYSIKARIIDVSGGDILYAYTKSFESEKDLRDAVNIITKKMYRDLNYYIENEETEKARRKNIKKYSRFRINITPKINYLHPTGRLGESINNGYGITAEAGLSDVLIKNFRTGFEAGYYRFTGKVNKEDRCNFFTGLINAGYDIYFSEIFYLSPIIAAGFIYITLEHGENEGFAIEENSKKTEIEQIAKTGIELGVRLGKTLTVKCSMEYGSIFEEEKLMNFIVVSAGISMRI